MATSEGDPPPDGPEPICAACGADIGIFLRLGLDWPHYRQSGTPAQPHTHNPDSPAALNHLEVFDPGHDPVVAWRLTAADAMRL